MFSLETFGWRATSAGSGIIVLLVAWPLTRVFDHRPEDVGETPDGILHNKINPSRGQKRGFAAVNRGADFTAKEAVKTRAFWFMAFGHGTSLLIVGAVMVHLLSLIHI